MNYQIIYYEDRKGVCSIYNFIESQKKRDKAKIFSWLSLLEEKGPNLHRPYSDFLEMGIHELRIKLSGEQVRILYYFCFKDFIVLTHSFNKKSKQVPKREINKAIKYRIDFLNRYTEKALRRSINENL